MSDNGIAAEDDRTQMKDEGGDDEVREGPFCYIYYHDLRIVPRKCLGILKDCKIMGLIKNCAGRNISYEEKGS